MKRALVTFVILAGTAVITAAQTGVPAARSVRGGVETRSLPTFEVDRAWPKIPAKWKTGDPSSFAIDAQDNVWLLHRPRTLTKP